MWKWIKLKGARLLGLSTHEPYDYYYYMERSIKIMGYYYVSRGLNYVPYTMTNEKEVTCMGTRIIRAIGGMSRFIWFATLIVFYILSMFLWGYPKTKRR